MYEMQKGYLLGVAVIIIFSVIYSPILFYLKPYDIVKWAQPQTWEKTHNGVIYRVTVEEVATYNQKGVLKSNEDI